MIHVDNDGVLAAIVRGLIGTIEPILKTYASTQLSNYDSQLHPLQQSHHC